MVGKELDVPGWRLLFSSIEMPELSLNWLDSAKPIADIGSVCSTQTVWKL
jgi:hypothetical protein